MSEIANAQAIKFCNERARPMADLVCKLVRTMPQFMIDVAEFEKYVQENVEGDLISDGSDIDGRSPLSKKNIAELKFVIEQLIACMDTDDRAALAQHVAVNTQPIF